MPRVNINNKYNNGRTGGSKVFLEPAKSEIYFADSTRVARGGDTIFTTAFPINQVFKNNVIVDVSAYTGQGTNQITFLTPLNAYDQVYLTT